MRAVRLPGNLEGLLDSLPYGAINKDLANCVSDGYRDACICEVTVVNNRFSTKLEYVDRFGKTPRTEGFGDPFVGFLVVMHGQTERHSASFEFYRRMF